MKTSFVSLALAVSGASAVLVPRQQCCFQLTAAGGGLSGVVGQLSDGQNRVNQSLPAATYCLSGGAITDGSGRGCILTPPTSQFQCDTGAKAQTGFSIGSAGAVAYNGSSVFKSCPTGDHGGYNIYETAPAGQAGCVSITLNTVGGACANSSSSSSSSSKATSSASSSKSSSVSSSVSSKASSVSSVSSSVSSKASSASTVSTIVSIVTSKTSSASPTASSSASKASTSPVSTSTVAPVTTTSTKTSSVATTCTTVVVAPTTTVVSTVYITVNTCASSSAPSSSSRASSTSSVPIAPVSSTASSSKASSTSASSTPASSSKASGTATVCQTSLSGAYQTPHLIVPVNQSAPSTAYGTQYNGIISPSCSSIFNFDIPASYAGHTCTLIFLFPTQAQLQTSSFTMSGSGGLTFTQLTSPASSSTTWNNMPASGAQLAKIAAAPGNSYVVSTGSCAAGTTLAVEVSAYGSYALNFFEDYNPSPIGLFLTSC
ncbi:hypothetical protein MBLNU459_g5229t1 [Dothideomycetes sp. NU459]